MKIYKFKEILPFKGQLVPELLQIELLLYTAPTAGPAGPANVTVLTASQSGTTFVIAPDAATNDWSHCTGNPTLAVGIRT